MTKEQQYWEDTQEALNRIFNRCEEIDPQSGYDMLEDIQFVRGFIYKHKPQESEGNEVLNKIRAEIEQQYTRFRNGSDMWDERACGLGTALDIIDKYRKEQANGEQ